MQFGRGCHLWGQVCPLPSSSGCCTPASLPLTGNGLVYCRLAHLWYSLSPLFCERAWQCVRIELFVGKVSLSLSSFFFFFPLSGYPTVWVVISRYLPQIVLRVFRPSLYPKQYSPHLPVQPPLAGGLRECLGYLSAGSCS